METEIISRECIKPSSPTPLHLKTYKLSLLDQCNYHSYFPMILYYPFNPSIDLSQRLQLLKQSLQETLTGFYPFAGKIKDDDDSIDCNDEGILFIETRAKSTSLNEFFNQFDVSRIRQLLPLDGGKQSTGSGSGRYVAKIQVTTFSCGGLSICACLSHSFGDGITLGSFIKSWAAEARKNNTEAEEIILRPNNDATFLFPQMNAFPKEATWVAMCKPFCKSGRCVTRRFVFDAKAILALKTKAAATVSSSNVHIKPSRVEVGSAFLSKRIMNALKPKAAASQQKQKPILLTHLVNLRRKVNPPLSEYAMGNIVWTANALCSSGEEEMELDGLVLQLREAIGKLDEGFVQSIQGDVGYLKLQEAIKNEERAFKSVEDRITFSSWCNFGLYNIDFGWGKPVWLSYVGCEGSIPNFSNHVVLVDTRCGGGIEAWVYLLEEDMNILEKDEQLLAFATMDPCPVDGILM